MTTDNDHISNLIARLLDKKHHFEQRVQEAEEAIHGLRRTQALLNDVYTFEAPEPEKKVKKGGKRQGITAAVTEWVAKEPPGAEIRTVEINKDLPWVKTPNSIRSALLSLTKQGKLIYTQGAGFHKPDRIGQQTEDELVYSSSLPRGGYKE